MNSEQYFSQNFVSNLISNPPEKINQILSSLLSYLLDLDLNTNSISSLKPFHFLLENLCDNTIFQISEESNKILIGCIIVQLLILLKTHIKLKNDRQKKLIEFLIVLLKINIIDPKIYFIYEKIHESNFCVFLKNYPELQKEFLKIIFSKEILFAKEPDLIKILIELLDKILEDDDFQELNDIIFNYILIAFLEKHNKPNIFNFSKELLNKSSTKTKQKISIKITSIFKKRKENTDLSIENILQIIPSIFKIDCEILIDILPIIDSLIQDEKQNDKIRANSIISLGKLIGGKKSRISFLSQKVFKDFINLLSIRKFIKLRYELLKSYFKFIQNFSFYRVRIEKQEFSQENHIYSESLNLIENVFSQFLINNEKDNKNKLFLIERIGFYTIKSSDFFSFNFLKSIFLNVHTKINELNLKTSILKIFADIFNFYCGNYFINNFFVQKTDNYSLSENFPDLNEKYIWIIDEFLSLYLKISVQESIIYQYFFNRILIKQNSCLILLGIQYQIIKKLIEEDKLLFPNQRSLHIFIYRTLGNKWKTVESSLSDSKSIIMNEAFDFFLKNRKKIRDFAVNRFDILQKKENNKFIDHKLKKYSGFNEQINVKKITEELEKAISEDKSVLSFIDMLLSAKKEPKEREINRGISLDFLGKKIKENNLDILIDCWFIDDCLEKEGIGIIIEKAGDLTEEIAKSKYFNEKNWILLVSCSKLLLSLKKYGGITNSNTIKIILDIIFLIKDKEIENKDNFKLFKEIIIVSFIKLLSKCKINKNLPENVSIEDFKDFLFGELRNNHSNPFFCKYAMIILGQLQEISSEDRISLIFKNSITTFDSERTNSRNINILAGYLLFYLEINDIKLLKNENKKKDFFDNSFKYIEDFRDYKEEKLEIISETAILKSKLIKILIHILFVQINSESDKEIMINEQKKFITILTNLILNLSPNNTISDSSYLRMTSLIELLNLFTTHFHSTKFTCNLYKSLSYLCFDENFEIRKLLFHKLIKHTSGMGKTLETPFLSLLFFFLIDENKALSFLAQNVLTSFLKMLDGEITKKWNKMKFDRILMNSGSFSIVFLTIIFENNQFFKNNDKIDYKTIGACLEKYFSILSNVSTIKTRNLLGNVIGSLKQTKFDNEKIENKINFYKKKHLKIKNLKIIDKFTDKNSIIDFIEEMAKEKFPNGFGKIENVLEINEEILFEKKIKKEDNNYSVNDKENENSRLFAEKRKILEEETSKREKKIKK